MRTQNRRALSWVAIYAVALHTMLTGIVLQAHAASVDPFTIICHSDTAGAPAEQTPASPASVPAQACDHCNLCSVAAPPVALATAFAGQLAPARLLQTLRPVSAAAHSNLATTPKLARGPPSFA
jgi:hypothetical protein